MFREELHRDLFPIRRETDDGGEFFCRRHVLRFKNVAEEMVSIAGWDGDVPFDGEVVFCLLDVFAVGGVDGGGMGDRGTEFITQGCSLFLEFCKHSLQTRSVV